MTPLARVSRSALAFSLFFFGVGATLGGWVHFLSGDTSGELFPPTIGPILLSLALVGGMAVLGTVLLIPSGGRSTGRALLGLALVTGIGWGAGATLGPSWQPGQTLAGHLRLELANQANAVIEGDAICRTLPNSNVVESVDARPLGRIGLDDISVRVRLDGAVDVLVNQIYGYSGRLEIEPGPDSRSRVARFTNLTSPIDNRLGGASGPTTISGTVAWTCGETIPIPSGRSDTGNLEGWFVLTGVVHVDPLASDAPFPPPGRALGRCDRRIDLRTDRLETTVDWVEGRRAHLALAFDRTTATLTIERDDGSPPEVITSTPTIEERRPTTGRFVLSRRLSIVVATRDGMLSLTVEWDCGDSLEVG